MMCLLVPWNILFNVGPILLMNRTWKQDKPKVRFEAEGKLETESNLLNPMQNSLMATIYT